MSGNTKDWLAQTFEFEFLGIWGEDDMTGYEDES